MDAPDRQRSLLALHGSIVLLLGLLCGLPAVAEELAGSQPTTWRAAHGAMLLAGVWLIATAALLPSLILPPRQRMALAGSLIATAYAFTSAAVIQAATGVRALAPHGTVSSWVAYVANLATVAGGLVAALLTLLGAKAALTHPQQGPAGTA